MRRATICPDCTSIFALGKVECHANRLQEARNALLFAEKCRSREPIDFVFELLARFTLDSTARRRPFPQLSRFGRAASALLSMDGADVLCAVGRHDNARSALEACIKRDRRSRHKGLIRLCGIEYLSGDYRGVMVHAREAGPFREQWIAPARTLCSGWLSELCARGNWNRPGPPHMSCGTFSRDIPNWTAF